ncbi:MAG: rhodanese-like domain-containing protein [Bacteroidia bacterium]
MQTIKELLQNPQATILDVRSPMEYQSGHIEGAVNIPVDEIAHRTDELKALTPPFILYCRSGARSSMAAQYMMQAGFSEVYNAGGLADIRILTM